MNNPDCSHNIDERQRRALVDCPICLEKRIGLLQTRLESNFCFNNHGERISVPDGSIPDGIECRDETIKLLDKEIKRLRILLENPAVTADEWRRLLDMANERACGEHERAEQAVRERDALRELYNAKIPLHERRKLPSPVWNEGDDALTASFWPDCTCVECYALHHMATARSERDALRQVIGYWCYEQFHSYGQDCVDDKTKSLLTAIDAAKEGK